MPDPRQLLRQASIILLAMTVQSCSTTTDPELTVSVPDKNEGIVVLSMPIEVADGSVVPAGQELALPVITARIPHVLEFARRDLRVVFALSELYDTGVFRTDGSAIVFRVLYHTEYRPVVPCDIVVLTALSLGQTSELEARTSCTVSNNDGHTIRVTAHGRREVAAFNQ